MSLEPLRAQARHHEVREHEHRDDEAGELGAAHIRSSPSSTRNSAPNASAANAMEDTSRSESRTEAITSTGVMRRILEPDPSRTRGDAARPHQDPVKAALGVSPRSG